MDCLFCYLAVEECGVRALAGCSGLLATYDYSDVPMSRQTVDWVCRRFVVSCGSWPQESFNVAEQGLGFRRSGGGQGFRLLPSRLGQAICSVSQCLESHSGLGFSERPLCILH